MRAKTNKTLRTILAIMFLSFLLFFALPSWLVSLPFIQKKIAFQVSERLSKKLNVNAQFDRISISWLNALSLKNVIIPDQQGDTLVYIKDFESRFNFISLLKGKPKIHACSLYGAQINLYTNPKDSSSNIDFLLRALSSKNKKKAPNIVIEIHEIELYRCSFSYREIGNNTTSPHFNPKNLNFSGINAKAKLNTFSKDSINAEILRFRFYEHSGIKLENIRAKIIGDSQQLNISNLIFTFPHSKIEIPNAIMDYKDVTSIDDFLEKTKVNLTLTPSEIAPRDAKAFIPILEKFTDKLRFSGFATGNLNALHLEKLNVHYGDKMFFRGNLFLGDLFSSSTPFIDGKVEKMSLTPTGLWGIVNIFGFSDKMKPELISRLGKIQFVGHILGPADSFIAQGNFKCDVGEINTQAHFDKISDQESQIKGSIKAIDFNIAQLETNKYLPEQISTDVELELLFSKNKPFYGKILGIIPEMTYQKHHYQDIRINTSITPNNIKGNLILNDPFGAIHLNATLQLKQPLLLDINLDLKDFSASELNLIENKDFPQISGKMTTNLLGQNLKELEGSIIIDSLLLKTKNHSMFDPQIIIKNRKNKEKEIHFSIRSLLGDISYKGNYTPIEFINHLNNLFLHHILDKEYLNMEIHSFFEFQAKLNRGYDNFWEIIALPVIFHGETNLNISKKPDSIFIFNLNADTLFFINKDYDNINIKGYEEDDELSILSTLNQATRDSTKVRTVLDFKAKKGSLNAILNLEEQFKNQYLFNLKANSSWKEEIRNNKVNKILFTTIEAPQFKIHGIDWKFKPSQIIKDKNSVKIKGFQIEHKEQYLKADGVLSSNPEDKLTLDLNQVELSYLMDLINIPILDFGGSSTGKISISDITDTKKIEVELDVNNYSFNNEVLGHLKLFGDWNESNQSINLLGTIYNSEKIWTDVSGFIRLGGENPGLSLYFDANRLNVGFVTKYLQNLGGSVKGNASGELHLHGPFSELLLEGDAYIHNGQVGFDIINTQYKFNDSLHFDNKGIYFNDIAITDKYGNKGRLNANIYHKSFDNWIPEAKIDCTHFLAYDVPPPKNNQINGSIFGTGSVSINTVNDALTFNIVMKTEPGSYLKLNVLENDNANDYNFIYWTDQEEDKKKVDSLEPLKSRSSDLLINVEAEITPDASIEFIIDSNSGDKIKAKGNGNLEIQYSVNDPIRIYGTTTIVEGNYGFNLEQVIQKSFSIEEGSQIKFQGDPMNANINIKAIYHLNANLSDLFSEAIFSEQRRTTVPVECILKLDGTILHPSIGFDIELPNSNDDLRHMVKSLIDTEEMMTRQMAYLLILGKFYTPEGQVNSYSTSNFAAVASSTLSQQLSSLLSSITDKVQIDTRIHTTNSSFEDTNIEVLLSSQLLDNRLLINGNLGYKDNPYIQNTFIGEFDLEYKLNPSGGVRLKAYNHYNDMYQYLKQSPTTQGVGIIFRKDFNHFLDFFKKDKLKKNQQLLRK